MYLYHTSYIKVDWVINRSVLSYLDDHQYQSMVFTFVLCHREWVFLAYVSKRFSIVQSQFGGCCMSNTSSLWSLLLIYLRLPFTEYTRTRDIYYLVYQSAGNIRQVDFCCSILLGNQQSGTYWARLWYTIHREVAVWYV